MTQFSSALDRINAELAKAYGSPPAPTMTKAHDAAAPGHSAGTMDEGEFMEKALAAVSRGHLTTTQLIETEMRIQNGKQPDPQIVKSVVRGVPYSPFG